jgi:hypothetical protein
MATVRRPRPPTTTVTFTQITMTKTTSTLISRTPIPKPKPAYCPTTTVYATILPSHTSSGNTGVISGGVAAGASILTLFLLCFFWHRRQRQQFKGAFDFDRLSKGSTGHTETTGTDIATYGYDPEAGAVASMASLNPLTYCPFSVQEKSEMIEPLVGGRGRGGRITSAFG